MGSSNAVMPWTQRVEMMQKLQKELKTLAALAADGSSGDDSSAGDWIAEVFSTLAEGLVKQKNPNVLREFLITVPMIATWVPQLMSPDSVTGGSSAMLAWRSLLLETIHTLRHTNKSGENTVPCHTTTLIIN